MSLSSCSKSCSGDVTVGMSPPCSRWSDGRCALPARRELETHDLARRSRLTDTRGSSPTRPVSRDRQTASGSPAAGSPRSRAAAFEQLAELVHEDVQLVSKVRAGTVVEGRARRRAVHPGVDRAQPLRGRDRGLHGARRRARRRRGPDAMDRRRARHSRRSRWSGRWSFVTGSCSGSSRHGAPSKPRRSSRRRADRSPAARTSRSRDRDPVTALRGSSASRRSWPRDPAPARAPGAAPEAADGSDGSGLGSGGMGIGGPGSVSRAPCRSSSCRPGCPRLRGRNT